MRIYAAYHRAPSRWMIVTQQKVHTHKDYEKECPAKFDIVNFDEEPQDLQKKHKQ